MSYLSKRKIELGPLRERVLELERQEAELISRRDTMVIKSVEAAKYLDSLMQNINELSNYVEKHDQRIQEVADASREHVGQAFTVIEKAEGVLDWFGKALAAIDQKIGKASQELAASELAERVAHDRVVAEQQELSRIKDDLDIYRQRLEKKYAEVMPGHKIIL